MSLNQAKKTVSPHFKDGQLGKQGTSTYSEALVTDASTTVSIQGSTFNIGGSAQVHFIYGSHINQSIDKYTIDAIIKNLSRSHNAEYDMVANTTRGPCTPGTRVAILEEIVKWCNSINQTIYWMSGMAGTGKTTIVYSVSQMLSDCNLLGASFFCSRSLPDCRDVNLILPTIAFQLARRYSAFGGSLAIALGEDPDILNRGLAVQLRRLIIEPWDAKKAELPKHIVVVLDALDECEQHHAEFLRILFKNVTSLPFKVLLTSRPEPSIRNVVLAQDSRTLSMFVLHEAEEILVKDDIVRYIQLELKKCYPTVSCSPAQITRLADQCGKHFIYAATFCRFITDEEGDPVSRFESLLDLSLSEEREIAVEPINALYKEILSRILSNKKPKKEVEGIKLVLNAIVCAREPLTRRAIAGLLQWSATKLEARLKFLRSLILVPESEQQPLTIFHTSLSDFLLDHSRSGEFCCFPSASHLDLTQRCLTSMISELRQNPCDLQLRQSNECIPPEKVQSHISPSLRYATVYWADHWDLSERSERQDALESVREFLTTHILHWFECLSLSGKLSIGILVLEKLRYLLNKESDLVDLVYDSLRLIQLFYDFVKDNAAEVYSLALTWTPSNSPLRVHYANLRSHVPQTLCGVPSNWTGPDRVVSVHSDLVTSIAISQDGSRIVSGSKDKTIRIWNMLHQIEECSLEGHTGSVNSVAIYRNGDRVVSGSDDGTIRIWNTAARKVDFKYEGLSSVLAISLSPDEKYIASGHKDDLVYVWNPMDGTRVHSLRGHTGRVRSITFIPNTTLLASAGFDGTVRIWNAQTGRTERVLRCDTSHPLLSVGCSPDGDKIITGSVGGSAKVWHSSGKLLRDLSYDARYVTFLPGGERAVTSRGLSHGTLRIWDVSTGEALHTFTNTGYVSSVAVFPDGQRIASSSDNQVSIWSIRGSALNGTAKGWLHELRQVLEVSSMAFSSDGRWVLLLPSLRIVDTATGMEKAVINPESTGYTCGALSASGDRVAAAARSEIEVWELVGDGDVKKLVTLEPHSATTTTSFVSFSSDARQLISVSYNAARVWNIVNGNQIHILRHTSHQVLHASFSHDNTRIISSSLFAVHIWSAQSGQKLKKFLLQAHEPSVDFTLDDEHIIASWKGITHIFNSQTGELEYKYEGYHHWTTLDNNRSYALHEGGWVYCFNSFGDEPRRLMWVPSLYRPSPYNKFGDPLFNGQLISSSSQGIRFCLPRVDAIVTLLIPYDY